MGLGTETTAGNHRAVAELAVVGMAGNPSDSTRIRLVDHRSLAELVAGRNSRPGRILESVRRNSIGLGSRRLLAFDPAPRTDFAFVETSESLAGWGIRFDLVLVPSTCSNPSLIRL